MKPTGHPLDDCPAYFAWRHLGIDLYPWQVRALRAIGRGVLGGKPPTSLVAANGSGKTQRVIAASVLWFLWRFPAGTCPITSGSWTQIETQLFPALLLYRTHPLFKGWTFNQTEIKNATGGLAFGFSTSEPGRAEGHHTRGSLDIGPVYYIIDEAKTVPDGIFDAMGRCTLRYCLLTSSPGAPSGKFYRTHHEERELHHCIKATSADCPHIDQKKIERDRKIYGDDHPIMRSMHYAEFTADTDLLIINPMELAKALEASMEWASKIPGFNPANCTGFGDFAAGRDENVLAICDGKRVWIMKAWRDPNTIQGAREFVNTLRGINFPESNFHGDADGLGIGVIQQMEEEDYCPNKFHGGIPAEDEEHYVSAISEAWFDAGRMLTKGEIVLCGELARCPETIRQLTTRLSMWGDKGKLQAEPKKLMAKRGLKSPDRADAILCAIYKHFHSGGAITARTAHQVVTAAPATSQQGFATVVRW